MTVTAAPPSPSVRHPTRAFGEGWTIVERDLAQLLYTPSELVAQLVVPVVMVVLFGYIFGSAIGVPGGGNYRAYLMPGLFVFGLVTSIGSTALATADDAAKGIMDRFRSMPIARSAVPFGRTGATLCRNVLGLAVLAACGLAVGWRAHHGVGDTAAAFGLLLLMSYALSWVGAYLGLLVRNPSTADNLVPLSFPIAMVSNAFVPTNGMPAWLRDVANWNPLSSPVSACRRLFGNPGVTSHHTTWALQHPVIATLAWALALIVVFAPLATRRYRTTNR